MRLFLLASSLLSLPTTRTNYIPVHRQPVSTQLCSLYLFCNVTLPYLIANTHRRFSLCLQATSELISTRSETRFLQQDQGEPSFSTATSKANSHCQLPHLVCAAYQRSCAEAWSNHKMHSRIYSLWIYPTLHQVLALLFLRGSGQMSCWACCRRFKHKTYPFLVSRLVSNCYVWLDMTISVDHIV